LAASPYPVGMLPRLILRPGWLIGLVVLLALIGAGIWVWQSAHSSSPVSEEEALSTFRERAGAAEATRPGVPRQGVYTYRQSGSERGGAGPISIPRSLPDEARYVVAPIPGGFEEELALSEQHVEGVRFRRSGAAPTSPSSASAATTAATCDLLRCTCPAGSASGAPGRGATPPARCR
jgi:hypothetical protein